LIKRDLGISPFVKDVEKRWRTEILFGDIFHVIVKDIVKVLALIIDV